MVGMILIERICHCTTGVDAKAYFKELETRLNNGIFAEKNGNWVISTEGDELKMISLSNVTSHKFSNKIGELFDLVFEHRSDGGARMIQFQTCVDMHPQIMEKLRQRHDFKDGEIVQLQKKY